jgi:hypothetical protein
MYFKNRSTHFTLLLKNRTVKCCFHVLFFFSSRQKHERGVKKALTREKKCDTFLCETKKNPGGMMETKTDIAHKYFKVSYRSVLHWTKGGVPKRRRADVDGILSRQEKKIGIKEGGTPYSRRTSLSNGALFMKRLSKAFEVWS